MVLKQKVNIIGQVSNIDLNNGTKTKHFNVDDNNFNKFDLFHGLSISKSFFNSYNVSSYIHTIVPSYQVDNHCRHIDVNILNIHKFLHCSPDHHYTVVLEL